MIQHFFIEGEYLGSSIRTAQRVHESIQAPWSLLFYCECCGEPYAKAPVELADGSISPWQANRGRCRRHEPTVMFSAIPGSIWSSWDKAFTEALPMPVLQWELERHLEAYERLQNV